MLVFKKIFLITPFLFNTVRSDAKDASSALFSGKKEEVYKNSFFDETCNQMANEKPVSKCVNDADTMEKICKKACMDKLPYFKSTKYDDDGEFFELNAKRWNGSSLDFERFIGFITLIINVPVTCQDSAGEKDNLLRDFNRLMKITPRSSIEYVLFPVISGDHQCDDEKLRAIFADIDANKNVQMMEALGSSDEFSTHPVYQYLMTITGIKEIGNDISTIMSINPMGSQIDVLEGQTHEKVKRYSVENLQTWEL